MANFITFDGLNFHNLDKINTITFNKPLDATETKDEVSIHYFFEIIADKEIIYTSKTYTISVNGNNVEDNLKRVKNDLNRCIALIN